MNIKKKLIEIMYSQRWSFRIYENYSVYHKGMRRIAWRKFICIVSVPIALITYPFRRRSLHKFVDKNSVYELKRKKYKGLKVYVPDYDTDIMQKYFIMMDRIHDFDFIEDFSRKYLKKGMVIFDIGGNVGNHTIYWAMHSEPEKIYTFEPNLHTFKILSKNIELNNLMSKVKLFNCGCGKEAGKSKMIIDIHNSGATQMAQSNTGECEIITLDSLEVSQCDFMKIDVEGMEYDVIIGARNIIEKYHPLILLEIFEENYKRVDALLCSLGYKKVNYDLISWRHDYLYKYEMVSSIEQI